MKRTNVQKQKPTLAKITFYIKVTDSIIVIIDLLDMPTLTDQVEPPLKSFANWSVNGCTVHGEFSNLLCFLYGRHILFDVPSTRNISRREFFKRKIKK